MIVRNKAQIEAIANQKAIAEQTVQDILFTCTLNEILESPYLTEAVFGRN